MKLFGFPFRKSLKTAAACSYCPLAKRARPRLKVSCSACEGASSCRAAVSGAAWAAALAKGDRTSAAASAAAPIEFHLLKILFLRRAGASLFESNDPARTRETHVRRATGVKLSVRTRRIIQPRGRAGQGARRRERAKSKKEGRPPRSRPPSSLLNRRGRDLDAVAGLEQRVGHDAVLYLAQAELGRRESAVGAGAQHAHARGLGPRRAARGEQRLRQGYPRVEVLLPGRAHLAADVVELGRADGERYHVAGHHERVEAGGVVEVDAGDLARRVRDDGGAAGLGLGLRQIGRASCR